MHIPKINIQKVLFAATLVLLVVPFLQATFEIFKERPLKGAIEAPQKTPLNAKSWFSGEFQEHREKYLNESFGFRNLFIRINNQMAFSLFNNAKANGVIIGKERFLYEEGYIDALYGRDYIGHDSIYTRLHRLKQIQDTLASLNKQIILVFAAGKGSFYPEYIPDRLRAAPDTTNYTGHLKVAQQLGVTHIDFNRYFLSQKQVSAYPLYPQYGIHWSVYGMCLAADSIQRFIEHQRNIDLPNLYWDEVKWGKPDEYDYDVADGMNILFRLKTFPMAYPQLRFESDSSKTKPAVLVIADSYYWGMFNFGITQAFSESHFWFYNHQIYPDSYQSPLETSQVNLADEIARHDVIVLMATDATLHGLGWGFIEKAHALYYPGGI